MILTIVGLLGLLVSVISLIFLITEGIGGKDIDFLGFVIGAFCNVVNAQSKASDKVAIGGYAFSTIASIFTSGLSSLSSSWITLVPLALTAIHLGIVIRDNRRTLAGE